MREQGRIRKSRHLWQGSAGKQLVPKERAASADTALASEAPSPGVRLHQLLPRVRSRCKLPREHKTRKPWTFKSHVCGLHLAPSAACLGSGCGPHLLQAEPCPARVQCSMLLSHHQGREIPGSSGTPGDTVVSVAGTGGTSLQPLPSAKWERSLGQEQLCTHG